MNKTKILEEFDELMRVFNIEKREPKYGEVVIDSAYKSFLSTTIDTLIGEIEGELKGKIDIAKTRKRRTPFQDTLFNYEVNTLSDILTLLATYKQ